MRLGLLVALMLAGCRGGMAAPTQSVALTAPATSSNVDLAPPRPSPIVDANKSYTFGPERTITAPPGSATAGSKWLEIPLTFKNSIDHPIWMHGYLERQPFILIQLRHRETDEWVDYGPYYCGNGTRNFKVAPGEACTVSADLPARDVGQEFRILILFRNEPKSSQPVYAASGRQWLTANP